MRSLNYEELNSLCSRYLKEYSSYEDDERIFRMQEISNVLEEMTRNKAFKICDMGCVEEHSEKCQKLESAMGIILLYLSLTDNWYYNRESKDVLREAAFGCIPDTIKKSFLPYVSNGLKHQLAIGQRLFMKNDDLGSQVLSDNCRYVFTNIIHMTMWLESKLKELGIDVSLIGEAVKDFSSQEIWFIYAQLADFDRCESSFDEDAREELYKVMKCRGLDEKREFIRTICLLGYCNHSEGISAMMMDMYDICGSEGICHMMYEFMMDNGEWKYGISDGYLHNALPQVHGAYLLRKSDEAALKKIKTVKQYMNDSFNNLVKRKTASYC